MYCNNCGAEAQPGQKFCNNCGAKLLDGNMASQVPQGQQTNPALQQQANYPQNPTQQYQYQQEPIPQDPTKQQPQYLYSQNPPQQQDQNGKNSSGALWWVLFTVIIVFAIGVFLTDSPSGSDTSGTDDSRAASSSTSSDATSSEEPEESSSDITIPESVIYDGNGVIIKVTGCEQGWSGTDINFYIENNSSLNLNIDAHSYAVNGIMTRNNIYDMYTDVAAGQKANATLTIGNDVLDRYGIDTIRNIEINFWAYDNDESFKEFETGQLQFGTSADDGTYDVFAGTTLLDENGIKVDYLGRRGNDFTYVMTNNTGSYFTFDLENLTTNGFTSSDVDYDLYDEEILAGCQYVFAPEINISDVAGSNVDNVESLQFNLKYRLQGDFFNEATTSVIVNNDPQANN